MHNLGRLLYLGMVLLQPIRERRLSLAFLLLDSPVQKAGHDCGVSLVFSYGHVRHCRSKNHVVNIERKVFVDMQVVGSPPVRLSGHGSYREQRNKTLEPGSTKFFDWLASSDC